MKRKAADAYRKNYTNISYSKYTLIQRVSACISIREQSEESVQRDDNMYEGGKKERCGKKQVLKADGMKEGIQYVNRCQNVNSIERKGV